MAVVVPTNPAVDDPTKASLAIAQNLAISVLDAQLATSLALTGVVDGSFEQDTFGTAPDTSWDVSLVGSATALTTATQANVNHGKQSLECNVNMDGDTVTLESKDYIPCKPGDRIDVTWVQKFANVNVTITVNIKWYYWTGAAFSAAGTASSQVFTDTTNDTIWKARTGNAVAPNVSNESEFYKIETIVGGSGGAATYYNVWLDGMFSTIYRGPVVVGFGHANNPVATITTNTTTTVTLHADMYNEELPKWAIVVLSISGSGNIDVSVEDTSGNVFWPGHMSDATSYVTSPQILVPLDNTKQFQVVTTNGSGSPSLLVNVVGYNV